MTITLTGRGRIVFTEVIEHEPGKPQAIAPITGGTGEFLGATGTVTAKVLPSAGDFVITISNQDCEPRANGSSGQAVSSRTT